jgi:Fe-S-cluster containining protein
MKIDIPPHQILMWWHAAHNPAIAETLDSLHKHIHGQTTRNAPVCWASGRCCHFDTFGHRLYVTGIETAYTLRCLTKSETPASPSLPILNNLSTQDACPFLVNNSCSIHENRPSGCRIFFCDRTATPWTNNLYEHTHEELKTLHEQHDIPYVYADWRLLLEAFERENLTPG